MNSDSTRLRSIDWIVILLAGATGIIHLFLGITQLGDGGFLPISFVLNGIAYLGLIIAIYFLGAFKRYRVALQWALVALAAVTLILYFVFNGLDGLSSPLGMITKAIELALIIVLVYDLGH